MFLEQNILYDPCNEVLTNLWTKKQLTRYWKCHKIRNISFFISLITTISTCIGYILCGMSRSRNSLSMSAFWPVSPVWPMTMADLDLSRHTHTCATALLIFTKFQFYNDNVCQWILVWEANIICWSSNIAVSW